MAYFDGIFWPIKGEESFSKFLNPDPDPDDLRGGLKHGDNTSYKV